MPTRRTRRVKISWTNAHWATQLRERGIDDFSTVVTHAGLYQTPNSCSLSWETTSNFCLIKLWKRNRNNRRSFALVNWVAHCTLTIHKYKQETNQVWLLIALVYAFIAFILSYIATASLSGMPLKVTSYSYTRGGDVIWNCQEYEIRSTPSEWQVKASEYVQGSKQAKNKMYRYVLSEVIAYPLRAGKDQYIYLYIFIIYSILCVHVIMCDLCWYSLCVRVCLCVCVCVWVCGSVARARGHARV